MHLSHWLPSIYPFVRLNICFSNSHFEFARMVLRIFEVLATFQALVRMPALFLDSPFATPIPISIVFQSIDLSLAPRHPTLSGRSVPGYSALLLQDGGRQTACVYQDKGNRAADRADQTSRRIDWRRGYIGLS